MSATRLVWAGHPTAPAPLGAALRARRSGQPVELVDDAGAAIAMSPLLWLREAVRLCWFWLLELKLTVVAALGGRGAVPPPPDAPGRGGGPVVLLLPVLPDLSHTFIYREALALLRRHPEWRVVALQPNPTAPVHAEAAALLRQAVFVPRDGITRAARRKLGWLLRGRGRALFALYRQEPGGSVHDLLGKNPLRDPRHPGNAFALADRIADWRPRAIHVFGSTYSANVAMGASLLLDLPFSITSYVDFEFAYAHRMLATKVARAAFFRVCTACCRDRLRGLVEVAEDRVPVVYFGLDLTQWQEQAPLPGRGVMFSAARLVPKKGLLLLPPALRALADMGIACHWRVAGDGPELEPLRQLVQQHGVADRVLFLGPLDNAAVRRELLAADAAVLPCVETPDGERDGIPIFLTEAMALGVPVVTTPVGGIPELVRDGETGVLTTPGDLASLTAALASLLRDAPAARALGARGRAEVHRTMDVEQSATQLLALIEGAPLTEGAPR